jgi:hypothetical protein
VPNPFGEEPVPRWRLRVPDRPHRPPKRYTAVAASLGPMTGLFIKGVPSIDRPTRDVVVVCLTLIPPLLVELWWKQRSRRQAEQLLVLSGTRVTGLGRCDG